MESRSKIDIKEYWAIVTRRKSLLVLPVIIIPLVAFAISFFLPRTYRSTVTILLGETRILPPTVEQQLEGRLSYAPISGRDLQSSVHNQITSTRYLRRLIAVLDLPISSRIRQVSSQTKASYPQISENELAEIILTDLLRKDVSVSFKSQNLFEISFTSSDPVSAQRRARALADIFIEESLAQELAGVRSNITFSEEQLELYKDKLKTAEERLKAFRQELLVSEAQEDTSGFNLRQILSAVEALDLEISMQESKLTDLRGRLVAGGIDVGSLTLPDEIAADREKLIETISALTEILARHSWKDPQVLGLNETAKDLLSGIDNKLDAFVRERYADRSPVLQEVTADFFVSEIGIEFNRAKRTTLDRSLVSIKNRLSRDPDTEITLQRLQSEIDNHRSLYELFVSRAQYAAINQSAKKVEAEAKYTVTKPASLPLGPESPDRKKLLMMGLMLGLVLGGGAILVVEVLDNSFKKIEDIEHYLGVRVIGTIPRMALPFNSNLKKRVPILIGGGVSLLLVALIIFLKFTMSG